MLAAVRSHKGQARVHPYWVNNTILYEGAILEINSSGVCVLHVDAATNNLIVGVAAHYVDATGASVVKEVLVYDDPAQIFRATMASGTVTITNIGNTADASGNANNSNNISSVKVGTLGTTASKALKVVGIATKSDNIFGWQPGIVTTSVTSTEVYLIINPIQHYWLDTNAI